MGNRRTEAGPAYPVVIVEDRSGGSSGGAVTLDATQLAALIAAIGKQASQLAATTNVHAPADNTAAVVTYTGSAGVSHVISGVAWGYDADPTGGLLTITVDGAVVFSVPVTKSGPGFFPFVPPLRATAAKTLVITLAAGGGTVQGYVSVPQHWTE